MLPGAQEITLTFQLKITCRQLLIYPEVLCISVSVSIHISYIWMIWYDISYICMIWYIIYIRICTPAATSDIVVTCMGKILAQIYIVVRTGHGKFGTCLLFRVLPSLCCAFMQQSRRRHTSWSKYMSDESFESAWANSASTDFSWMD